MIKTNRELLKELLAEITIHIDEYNQAITANDYEAMTKVEELLKEAETEYAKTQAIMIYDEMGQTENPMISAITRHHYSVASHKTIREDGQIVGFEYADKERQIDLVAMCRHLKMDCKWQYRVEKFNQLLTMKAAMELKVPNSEIKKIANSFYMNKIAQEIDMGKTPTSNTQVTKQLQIIIDEMIFVDDGNGKNKYKATSRDVAHLLMCHTQKGKKALTVRTVKNDTLHKLIMDIENRIILNRDYGIEFREAKDNSEDTHTTGGEVTVVKPASKKVKKEAQSAAKETAA